MNNTDLIISEYSSELDSNPKYSLEVDPENKYNLSEEEKIFIKVYATTKSLETAMQAAEMTLDDAKVLYFGYPCRQEVRRLNLAMYHRQFQHKILSVDEIAAYLSSLITDSFVVESERLKPQDKVKVAQTLLDIHKDKQNIIYSPEVITYKDIDDKLKDLSIESIKSLMNSSNNIAKKDELLKLIDLDSLSPEELALLKSLSVDELSEIVNINKK